MMNKILNEDIEMIINSFDFEILYNKNILFTGATGLIGSVFIRMIIKLNEIKNSKIKLILVVRDTESAEILFGKNEYIEYIESSVENFVPMNLKIDYIIHGASPTKSKYFIEHPVETLDTTILGTKNFLEQARISKVKSFVFLSSMEMYGTLNSSDVKENDLGYINNLNVRSSYSEGKRIGELYAYSYFEEYGVPIKIARVSQTFGAGISKNENRVYKVFADAVLNGQDIILKSSGTTQINFSYTTDTILGILYILLEGKNGEAYNIVSDKINMTILDSAKWLAEEYTNGKIKVIVDISNENEGFAPDNKMILNNEKLKNLGWKPKYNIKEGYIRLLKYLKEEKENEE